MEFAMNKLHGFVIATMVALAGPATSQAASIALQSASPTVQSGASFAINVVLNADDLLAGRTGIQGGLQLDYDPAAVRYDSLALVNSQAWSAYPVTSTPASGDLQFGFREAPRTGTVATLLFTAIGAPGLSTTVTVADADDFFGSFASVYPTNHTFNPNVSGANIAISAIPLPGAAWLMGAGLALLIPRLRRAGTARAR
jgi:hypothetical protein